MAWMTLTASLAVWGLFCIGFLIWGWLLRPGPAQDPVLLCQAPDLELGIRRCQWLSDFGLPVGRLIVISDDLPAEVQEILLRKYPNLEFCSLEALPKRLEVERKNLD